MNVVEDNIIPFFIGLVTGMTLFRKRQFNLLAKSVNKL